LLFCVSSPICVADTCHRGQSHVVSVQGISDRFSWTRTWPCNQVIIPSSPDTALSPRRMAPLMSRTDVMRGTLTLRSMPLRPSSSQRLHLAREDKHTAMTAREGNKAVFRARLTLSRTGRVQPFGLHVQDFTRMRSVAFSRYPGLDVLSHDFELVIV
jgi:hypothetical protein